LIWVTNRALRRLRRTRADALRAGEVSFFEDIPRRIVPCYKTARLFSNTAGSVMSARIAGARRVRAIIIACLLAATVVPPHGSIAQAATVYISGSPITSITAGTRYLFTPRASGTGTLKFVIENRPGWANFSSSTGTLSGRPGPEHVTREFNNIKISVISGTSRATLPAFSIDVKSSSTSGSITTTEPTGTTPESVTLTWLPPTENSDGTALTNLAGYRIYSGSSAGALTARTMLSNPGLTRYVVQSLKVGERYFAVASVSTKGVESSLSRVVELR
jgi:hypothetical protein